MTVIRSMIAPSHSIFFICDREPQDPLLMGEKRRIVSNEHCILVPCDPDGDIELIVGDSADLDEVARPTFDGYLQTPSRIISCQTVGLYELASLPIDTARPRVRIWTDRPDFPTRIVVGVD